MRESWSTCWYTPWLVLGGVLLAVLLLALAIVGALTASGPATVAPHAWARPLERLDFDDGGGRADLTALLRDGILASATPLGGPGDRAVLAQISGSTTTRHPDRRVPGEHQP
jgi:hypothetical protein